MDMSYGPPYDPTLEFPSGKSSRYCFLTAVHAAIILIPLCRNTMSLCIYTTILLASISNIMLGDKITKKVWDARRMLQEAFEKSLTQEAGLHLAQVVYPERLSQFMKMSTDVSG